MEISSLKIPQTTEKKFSDILGIIQKFCEDHLNSEYFDLSIKMLAKLARKRPSPLLSGKSNSWAAGIVHALGMVNFVFDKTQNPHITSKDMANWFDLGSSTINQKSKIIRAMLKIYQLDPQWSLPSKLKDNPMAWMISVNSYIIDVRHASYEVQVKAYEAGLIPYLPND